MPTPGANVDMPKITDTNVIAIMSDASEKLPAVARSSRGAGFAGATSFDTRAWANVAGA